MTLLLFTGHKVPAKRYKGLIDHLDTRNVIVIGTDDPEPKLDILECPIIVGHSVGILRALVYCHKNGIGPRRVISLDGSYLNRELLKDSERTDLFQDYIDSDVDPRNYGIHLFRHIKNVNTENYLNANQSNKDAMNDTDYASVYYYTEKCGHYPFESKRLLNLILAKIG